MPLRYIKNFDTDNIEKQTWDVLIVGSGIAGLYAAINLHPSLKVCVISKETMDENNSYLAQGGIAAAVSEGDLPEYHLQDTIKAGAGHCDAEAVAILVEEAPADIQILCNIGTQFDRNPDGTLTTTREGGHGRFRIVHALGDATGKEVVDSLLRECRKRSNIKIVENCFAIDILTNKDRCIGILSKIHSETENKYIVFYGKKIICASGGIGQVYNSTTNLEIITGDGIAMAYRAGAELSDMEFVQFHPTAFYNPQKQGSSFLITEAIRGEGGILKNIEGERFMNNYHEMGEIAPRDIVSRSIYKEMKKSGSKYVYLDITHKDSQYLKNRFPTIYNKCLKVGVDITKDYIPVCPVQHYFMGGIKTDLWGRTNIQGLYACGEAANTGVHGANRLASNSLLEGLVFGRRCAENINKTINDYQIEVIRIVNNENNEQDTIDAENILKQIQLLMDNNAGIERNERDMQSALFKIRAYIKILENSDFEAVNEMETINIAYIAELILEAAIKRKESIGSHYIVNVN